MKYLQKCPCACIKAGMKAGIQANNLFWDDISILVRRIPVHNPSSFGTDHFSIAAD